MSYSNELFERMRVDFEKLPGRLPNEVGVLENTPQGKGALLGGFLAGRADRAFGVDASSFNYAKYLSEQAGKGLRPVNLALDQLGIEGYRRGILGHESPFS